MAYARCNECDRRFDLTDTTDADEWHHGHDCEPVDDPNRMPTHNPLTDDNRCVICKAPSTVLPPDHPANQRGHVWKGECVNGHIAATMPTQEWQDRFHAYMRREVFGGGAA